jgi:hypothetical protein
LEKRASILRLSVFLFVVVFLTGQSDIHAKPIAKPAVATEFDCPPGLLVIPDKEATGDLVLGTPPAPASLLVTPSNCMLIASLSGKSVKPGPGDPDGSGMSMFNFDTKMGQLCMETGVQDIKLPATGTYLFRPAEDKNPKLVLPYRGADRNGKAANCVPFKGKTGPRSEATILDILANPTRYYVDIATTDFRNGALSGQVFGAMALNGALVASKPGDPDAVGAIALQLDQPKEQLCFQVYVVGLDSPATGMGIFSSTGDPLITLPTLNALGQASGCVEANEQFIRAFYKDLLGDKSPYVNIHSEAFPDGAIRGQFDRMWLYGES